MKTARSSSKGGALSLRPLALPPHERHVLANGLVLHIVPRHQLPLVAVRLVINSGGAFDGADKAGLADFMGRLLRRGAAGKSADVISEAVEFVGASISGFANEENVVVSLSTPARHFEPMMEMLAQVALTPDFPQNEVEMLKRRTLAQLQNELDDPGELADRALTRAVWGAHPFGLPASGTPHTVASFTREDALALHRQRLGPAISHLIIVGDVTTATALPVVERLFSGWSTGPSERPRVPVWPGLAQPGSVVIVDKPEQTQVQVRIGAKGVKRGHDEHFPLVVMNTVLGGGFTSRLVTEIRVKRGLSYGAGSSWDMMTGAGTFTVSSFTKVESLSTLLDVALGEVKKMRESGPTPKELATAQRYICGLYPSRLETNESISSALADIEHYHLPSDWVSTYRQRIAAVTRAEAARAAAGHLFEGEDRCIVLVGPAASVEKAAEKYGEVQVVKPSELE